MELNNYPRLSAFIRVGKLFVVLNVLFFLQSAAIGGEVDDARAALESAWKSGDYRAKAEAVEKAVETGDLGLLKAVVERALADEDQFVFERAVEALTMKSSAEGRAWLAQQATKHPSKDLRTVLVRMCGALATPGAVEAIQAGMKDREWTVRAAAVRAARERREKALVRPLIELVRTEDGRVREDAIAALRDLTGADYGAEADHWAGWWAGVEADFAIRPRASEEAEAAAREKRSDVGTATREGIYDIRSKRTLFVVDISASMEARTDAGSRLEVTKKELERAIRDLGDDMLFNVIVFSDKAQLWKPKMVKASDGNQAAAIKVVKAQKADGMTASHDALKLAFSLADVDTIWFLSDGFPTAGKVTSEEEIKSEVRKWNRTRGISVHTIAFVAGVLKGENEDKERAKEFMRELAKENGGTCKIIE